jgi:hypothetical protein
MVAHEVSPRLQAAMIGICGRVCFKPRFRVSEACRDLAFSSLLKNPFRAIGEA